MTTSPPDPTPPAPPAALSAPLCGPSGLCLRLVQLEDAAYIHDLRMDAAYNRFLSPVAGGVEAQRRWLQNYKPQESAGRQYYFVIQRADGLRCGLVRLYDISARDFTWGSWVLDHNKPARAALESALLIYVIGFDLLGLERAHFEVMGDNAHTLAFHRRFGARETGRDPENVYFEYTAAQFTQARAQFEQILGADA